MARKLRKLVADRLQFLDDLEAILFDTDKKSATLERSQLHRVLANDQSWIFGEDYALAVDDKNLTKVLQAHRHLLGVDVSGDGPVLDSGGRNRRVDLMLSRAASSAARRQHLVVELKRPSLTISQTELAQITRYASTVISDARFKSPDVFWDFWLIGDDIDSTVEFVTREQWERPPGLYSEGRNHRIWVLRWAQVLQDNSGVCDLRRRSRGVRQYGDEGGRNLW